MNKILGLAIGGIILSVLAIQCSAGHLENPADTLFMGVIPWGVVGIVGYAVIAISSALSQRLITYSLVGVTAFTTIWLVMKAVSLGLTCPFCWGIYLLNIAMTAIAIFEIYKWIRKPAFVESD